MLSKTQLKVRNILAGRDPLDRTEREAWEAVDARAAETSRRATLGHERRRIASGGLPVRNNYTKKRATPRKPEKPLIPKKKRIFVYLGKEAL